MINRPPWKYDFGAPQKRSLVHIFLFFVILTQSAATQNPPSVPSTVPNELTMLSGYEAPPITDDTWIVPYQNYRLSKVKMWKNNVNTAGFEVTFSSPDTYTGWPD